jgi:MOSC domain-containing protein YiiM
MSGSLTQISASAGGMPKSPLASALVTAQGVAGDRQRNRKHHGGADRAVCLYSEELYAWLRQQGVSLSPGQVGENFTTRGIDLLSLPPGEYLSVGECVIQLCSIRVPCRQLNMWHPDLLQIIEGHTGWLARVIVSGMVRPGDVIRRGRAAPSQSTPGCFEPRPLA